MTSVCGTTISAPSAALLRFLRSQSHEISFFNSSLGLSFWHDISQPGSTRLFRKGGDVARSLSKNIDLCRRRDANCEASILNLDISSHGPARNAYRSSMFCAESQRNILESHIHHGRANQIRQVSELFRPLFRKPWGTRRANRLATTKPDDLTEHPSFLNDLNEAMLSRSKAMEASNGMKLRGTELNENGDITLMNGEFTKSELIAKYGLLPRDLRKTDSSSIPHILVRSSAILMNLLHLRVLIKHDRVLLLDAYGTTDSYSQLRFKYDLQSKLGDLSQQSGGLPYEFRALEAVLVSVTSELEKQWEKISRPVIQVLRDLEEDIDRDKLRYLLIYAKQLGTFEQKARLVRDAIDSLLDADDDLVSMYLTERVQGKFRNEDDHTEVEMLLESYHNVCDGIFRACENLVNSVRNTEEIVKAILDANRNSLMLLDLKFSIGTIGIGSGAFIAGLFGMNLKTAMEESEIAFLGVTGFSSVVAMMICLIGLYKLRKIQRVSMYVGARGQQNPGSLNEVDALPPAFPMESRQECVKRSTFGSRRKTEAMQLKQQRCDRQRRIRDAILGEDNDEGLALNEQEKKRQ